MCIIGHRTQQNLFWDDLSEFSDAEDRDRAEPRLTSPLTLLAHFGLNYTELYHLSLTSGGDGMKSIANLLINLRR